MKFTNILMATDLSTTQENVFNTALELAIQNQAKLTIIHVMDEAIRAIETSAFLGQFVFSTSVPSLNEYEARLLEQKKRILSYLESKAKDKKVMAEGVVSMGVPWKEITHYATEKKCDLVILGKGRHSKLEQILIGSVAERVVRQLHCPVLILPALDSELSDHLALPIEANA